MPNTNKINIVCFRPDYLFKDLVNRFVDEGCVASDYPLEEAENYIWMRPQEILHYVGMQKKSPHTEMRADYAKSFPQQHKKDYKKILKNSVVIHHGTCFEPLYQFNHQHVAKALRNTKQVVGVCDFEECYGPSASIANQKNYSFIPIGFDDQVFSEQFIRKETRNARTKMNIGFVGRAYGTNNHKRTSSRHSHPLGYRKGGDIFLNTLLRLKALDVNFKVNILGQRWDDLVQQLEKYSIEHHYHQRDQDLTYRDYPKIYSNFDALFIGARCEGGPVSALEALSLGVPVIGTNVGVLRYLSRALPYGLCYTFDYDRKWAIADVENAAIWLTEVYNRRTTVENRRNFRKKVERLTTLNWVQAIIDSAAK